jgi:hypothetical protein
MNRLAESDAALYPYRLCIRNGVGASSFRGHLSHCEDLVPRIRTDLNAFSKYEAVALILHGAGEAERVFERPREGDRGQIAGRVKETVKALLGLRADDQLVVPRKQLATSHRIRFRGWRWIALGVLFVLTASCGLLTVAAFGHLPERIYYSLRPAPSLLHVTDKTMQDHLFERLVEQAASNYEPDTLGNGRRSVYSTDSRFHPPLGGLRLAIPIAETVFTNIADTGTRYVRVYFDGSPTIGQLVSLEKIDWETGALVVGIPQQAAAGRLWIILPESAVDSSKKPEWSRQSEWP